MAKAKQHKRPSGWIIFAIVALFLFGYACSLLVQTFHPPTSQSKTYSGIFPCADCSGLATSLTLLKSSPHAKKGTYMLHELYEGKTTTPFVTEGTWVKKRGAPFDNNAIIITLYQEGQPETNYWMKNENTLQLLDRNGEKISSPFNQTLVAKTTPKRQPPSSLTNPASVHCTQVGGNLVIQKRGDGGEYGLCQFEDNQACEEWALYRGDCPVGGVKTTGFDTIEQSYCAWLGGQTVAEPNASCTLPQGNVCSDEALYNGACLAN